MDDELNAPLGSPAPRPGGAGAEPPLGRPWGRGRSIFLTASAALLAVGGAISSFWPHDPYAGEPHAVARIEAPEPPPVVQSQRASEQTAPQQPDAAPEASGDGDEIQHGVRIIRSQPANPDTPGPLIIQAPSSSGVRLPPAPDWRVAEKDRLGVLPRIGAGGVKPMHVYARPFVAGPEIPPGAPKIALVVGGLGLNAAATSAAIDELPEAVTLAFAPYGPNLEQLAAKARERGHELLLQAPMEPFGFPDVDPGPHTLLTVGPDANSADLRWLMTRFSGYAGVMNFLGGRFTADEAALTPVLAELAQRGLFYLDDGASPQSVATSVAQRLSLPAAQVDVVLDAGKSPQALEAALVELEGRARKSGVAIGFANARPAALARIARFASELERKGIALAPVTATLDRSGVAAQDAGPIAPGGGKPTPAAGEKGGSSK